MPLFNKIINSYHRNVDLIIMLSTSISLTIGVFNEITVKPTNLPIEQFKNIIGYTAVGIGTGLTYPISFPIIGVILIMKK